MRKQVLAVGTPQSFRSTVARALEVEPDDVGWVQSVIAAEEELIEADEPIDVLVLSPEVKEPDALGLAEFVGRTAPMTAIVMVRDKSWNGLLPAAMRAGIRDVVDLTQGSEELRDAVERAISWAENLRQLRGDMPRSRRSAGWSSRSSRPRAAPARRSSRRTSRPRSPSSPARTPPSSTSTSTWATSSATSGPSPASR